MIQKCQHKLFLLSEFCSYKNTSNPKGKYIVIIHAYVHVRTKIKKLVWNIIMYNA